MFLSKTPIVPRTKKLLIDLASRKGMPEKENNSPYRGQLTLVNRDSQFFNFDGNLLNLIEAQADFNADKLCPQPGEYSVETYLEETRPRMYTPAEAKPALYLRRLEDIDETWVVSYLKNVIKGIAINKNDSIKSYNKLHRDSIVLVDSDDEETSMSDLLIENQDDYSAHELAKAKERIPYLLRRLHDRSKIVRVHLISLIIATEKARRDVELENRRNSSSKKISLKPSKILKYPVYKMNPDGTIGSMFGVNANKDDDRFKDAWTWIANFDDGSDQYYQNMVDLLYCYAVMGIDIMQEDPFVYQEDYISQLTVWYITNNKDYVLGKHRGFHKEVYKALKEMPLEIIENAAVVEELDTSYLINNTMNIFNDSVFIPSEEKEKLSYLSTSERDDFDRNMYVFIAMYNILYDASYDITKMVARDGFIFIDRETPLVLDISKISREPMSGEFVSLTDTALLNANGYLIKLSQGHLTEYLSIDRATEYLQEAIQGNTSARFSREKFGTWKGLSI